MRFQGREASRTQNSGELCGITYGHHVPWSVPAGGFAERIVAVPRLENWWQRALLGCVRECGEPTFRLFLERFVSRESKAAKSFI